MDKKIKWVPIRLPEDVLLGMIEDYEYWARQLSSVVNSNDDMAHMLRTKTSLKV